MLASKDNKPDFLSLQFSNLRQRLQAVNVGGVALERTPYGAQGVAIGGLRCRRRLQLICAGAQPS